MEKFTIHTAQTETGYGIITIQGKMNFANAGDILKSVRTILDLNRFTAVHVDVSGVSYFDASGAVILIDMMKGCKERNCEFILDGKSEKIDRFMRLIDIDALLKPGWFHQHSHVSFPVFIGEQVFQFLKDVKENIVFLGGLLIGLFKALRYPQHIRWSETLYFMEQAGANALPIVTLISFLIGFIMAFQSASQFQQYGASIYVADLVGLIITRELGPVMTAIILAGRSGGAFTAEIGTMKVSEEIDALSVMGFDVFRFLITPKILALNFMLPCLVLFGDVIGIAGGLIVGLTTLNLSLVQYMNETYQAIGLSDIFFGVIKSVAFGFLIAGIGCFRGLQVSGSADSVGRQTTSSVVTSIFAIIVSDAIFAIIGKYIPWF